ncbi:MAG: glycosyltransferase family 4 protein [Bacteroidota bacterium]
MKILQLCNKSPWPPKEGGSIAMNAMTETMLKLGHEVKILAMNTNKYTVEPDELPQDYRKKTHIEFANINLSIHPLEALIHLFNRESFIVKRFDNQNFRKLLRHTLENEHFDIVQLETLYLTPYASDIRAFSRAKIVLRSHNIEHQIWKRYASNIRNPLKQLYVKKLSKELETYEKEHLQDYDGVLTISDVDKSFYIKERDSLIIDSHPFSIDTSIESAQSKSRSHHQLFHLGSMDWKPNQEGIAWFLKDVWPEIQSILPFLKFHLAGRNISSGHYQLNIPGLVIDGEVDNAYDYMQSKRIMIVPLFSGSGIRIKIIEGMLNGNLIITTSIGAEGIHAKHQEHILIANTKDEFVKHIKWAAENPDQCLKITQKARKHIREKYDLTKNAHHLNSFYHKLLS